MKSFIVFLNEAATVGKHVGPGTWVHKNYLDQSRIPKDVHDAAHAVLKATHPDFEYNVVKHDKSTNNISFIHSPDFDTATEPKSGENVLVKSDSSIKRTAEPKDPSIWHQKHEWVGPDYKGFDVEQSKRRAVAYKSAIAKLAGEQGVPTSHFSNRIGRPAFWNKEVVPHIKEY